MDCLTSVPLEIIRNFSDFLIVSGEGQSLKGQNLDLHPKGRTVEVTNDDSSNHK